MSDEKPVGKENVEAEPVVTEVAPASVNAAAHNQPEPDTKGKPFGGPVTPVIALLFMIFLILFIVAIAVIKRGDGSAPALSSSDDPSLTLLKADRDTALANLNRQRMEMGLSPLNGISEPIEDVSARLKKDADTMVALAESFEKMIAEREAQISRKNEELLDAEQLRQSLSAEISRLQSDYQRALVGGSEAASLKRQLTEAEEQRDALSRQLSMMEQRLAEMQKRLAETKNAVNEDDFVDLQRRFDESERARLFFENRVKELEAQLSKASLFAESEDDLLPAAVELFRRLRQMEGLKDSDFTTEYSKLGVELGANVLHTLNFATGSSELSPEDEAHISRIVSNDVPDGDLILIIGYASETGNAEANQTLSSDRATVAAKYFDALKRSGQRVQAVYLGQTDRFSSRIPERNQICEIWRIRKK
ncbi:MAG: OmpA family protein [Luteolibacter sp.]